MAMNLSLNKLLAERGLAVAIIAILFVLQLHVAFSANVNWDEFLFLSKIHAFHDGRLSDAFQTFHVHVFGWLARVRISEVDQIVAGRMAMLLVEGGTTFCIFVMGRAMYGSRAAVFAVIVYLCSGYVLQHAASFRADPIAAFTMMASLTLLLTAPRSVILHVLAGMIAALGLLVTIKCALYLPAFLGVLAYRLGGDEPRPGLILRFVMSATVMSAVYAAGWSWHSAMLADSAPIGALQSRAGGALAKTVLTQPLFPQWPYILGWALAALAAAVLVLAGIAIAVGQFFRQPGLRAAALPLLAAPLLSLVVYRNAFPYFFPFIVAPASLAVGPILERLRNDAWRVAVFVLLLVPVGMQYGRLLGQDQSAQRAVIAAVHEMFPQPVPYIDRNEMISSFPKVGFFMSTWGLEGAVASGKPVLAPAIAARQPPLLLLNSPALMKAVNPALPYGGIRLVAADERALRENYIPHWGPVWVAGRRLTAERGERAFGLVIGGRYTVECRDGLPMIDGAEAPCGSVVALRPGKHRLGGSDGRTVTLRWGDHLPRPDNPPPDKPIYYGL